MRKKVSSKFIKQLWLEPEVAIEQLDLVYAHDNLLSIERKKKNETFYYELNGQILSENHFIKRVNTLVIPPAWEHVKIAEIENAHLQATGRDAKSRKQYRYHPFWNKIRNQTKFYRMLFFSEQLPQIRKQVDKDLQQSTWTKTKTTALVIRLLEETHIRIGNDQYAKRNKTYGLSTLRSRHLTTYKDKIKFNFTGKRGKEHEVTIRNKRLIKLVNGCHELPGWELFQYYDNEGQKQSIESGDVNAYIFSICHQHFTAKDFRTWSASKVFLENLYELETDDKNQNNLIKAYDLTAKALGNTRNVCKKYYVHPILPNAYEDDSINEAFEMIKSGMSKNRMISATEHALIKLIKQYRPKFNYTNSL